MGLDGSDLKRVNLKASRSKDQITKELRIEETFKSLLQIIPQRKDESGLYDFEIGCNIAELQAMSTWVSPLLVRFSDGTAYAGAIDRYLITSKNI